MMHSYSHSPLTRSTADVSEVTHEYEPDVDADGFRHPGNHHAELPGDYSPGSSLRPQSIQGRPTSKAGRAFNKVRPGLIGDEPKRDSFTFEHEPDVDGEGFRHPHENLSSPALRALQDVVVPLDPRAGRIVITPSPSLKPNYSPYRHIDDIPNRSIEDFQDPVELHSHANMIYGINEASASQFSVPDWQEGEAATFIEEASHGELHPPTVSARQVQTKLPIEPTGELIAPVGGIAGDNEPVGLTRNMKASDEPGIEGAYTRDGEGSAGLPFDANSGASKKEGDIEVADESSAVPADMSASLETIKPGNHSSSFATEIQQPTKPSAGSPGPVEDIKLPGETPLSQDGSAMQVDAEVKDERPEWLRAAEMMANNEYDRLAEEHLMVDERASNESIDFASAARATLMRDSKIDRGTSYPSFSEMEQANVSNASVTQNEPRASRQGVSNLPEKDLGGENPPTGSSAREDKFAVETGTPSFKAKDSVEPATAAKFLGLSAAAAAGASIPAAAMMTSERDAKSQTAGETNVTETITRHEESKYEDNKAGPVVPQHRPTSKNNLSSDTATPPSEARQPIVPRRPQSKGLDEGPGHSSGPSVPARPSKEGSSGADKAPPAVPRRPASSTGYKDAPHIPARPAKAGPIARELEIKAPIPTKPSIPSRPTPGKLAGSSKFAFASALEAKLKVGPAPPKKKEEVEKEGTKGAAEEAIQPLADARKGRPRGPQKRKPPTAAPVQDENASGQTVPSSPAGSQSPVFEKGPIFVSRFGVEMRSVSIQTGVIRISTPTRNMTVLDGAGTDYVGQTVVVDNPHVKSRGHAVSRGETDLEPVSNTAEPDAFAAVATTRPEASEMGSDHEANISEDNIFNSTTDAESLKVPEQSIQDVAGDEIKSFDKNHFTKEPKAKQEESSELAKAKLTALEEELEV